MKKVITLALALLMVCSMAIPAFATTTTLTTTVPQATYTLNIPANQEIPFGAKEHKIGSISVTDSSGFANKKNLDVTIDYSPFEATGVNTSIPYTLSIYTSKLSGSNDKAEILTGSTISFLGQADGTVDKYPKINGVSGLYSANIYLLASSQDWGKALAGEYSATITFTAEVVAE